MGVVLAHFNRGNRTVVGIPSWLWGLGCGHGLYLFAELNLSKPVITDIFYETFS